MRDDRCGRAAELERSAEAGEPDRRAVAMKEIVLVRLAIDAETRPLHSLSYPPSSPIEAASTTRSLTSSPSSFRASARPGLRLSGQMRAGNSASVLPMLDRTQSRRCAISRPVAEKSHHRHRRLLRARSERPGRRSAEERDKVAPPQDRLPSLRTDSKIAHLNRDVTWYTIAKNAADNLYWPRQVRPTRRG
jgi:hypothetical protein